MLYLNSINCKPVNSNQSTDTSWYYKVLPAMKVFDIIWTWILAGTDITALWIGNYNWTYQQRKAYLYQLQQQAAIVYFRIKLYSILR